MGHTPLPEHVCSESRILYFLGLNFLGNINREDVHGSTYDISQFHI